MAKVKLIPKCKLCKLFKRDKTLWIELHEKVLKHGITQTATIEWINSQVHIINARREDSSNHLDIFKRANFCNHFRNHFSVMDQVDAFLNDKDTYSNPILHPVLRREQLALGPVGEEVRDFKRTVVMVKAAEDRLLKYEERLHAKELQESEKKLEDAEHISLKEIQLFQKLIKELMNMKKELAVVQNKEAVAGKAVREALEELSRIMLDSLQGALIQQKTELSRVLPGSTIPDDMSKLVKTQIGEALKDEIPFVLISIYKRYTIK